MNLVMSFFNKRKRLQDAVFVKVPRTSVTGYAEALPVPDPIVECARSPPPPPNRLDEAARYMASLLSTRAPLGRFVRKSTTIDGWLLSMALVYMLRAKTPHSSMSSQLPVAISLACKLQFRVCSVFSTTSIGF